MAKLSPFPFWQFFDDNGLTIPGALLYTYAAGTDAPKSAFTDYTGDTPAANPIVADAAGRMEVWLGSGNYKFVLTDGENATEFDPDHIEGNVIKTVDYINGSMGGAGDTLSVDIIDDLRAVVGYNDKDIIYVKGHTTKDDGGGGMFYMVGDSTETDNNGTWILPDDVPATGRWKRLMNAAQPVDVRWFGAGHNTAGDNTGIQAAFDYAESIGANVIFGQGEYDPSLAIEIGHACKVSGDHAKIVHYTNFTTSVFMAEAIDGLTIENIDFEACKILEATICQNVEIKSNKLDGYISSTDELITKAIDIKGCTTVKIHDNIIENVNGGIYIDSETGLGDSTYSNDVDIYNNTVFNSFAGHSSDNPSGICIVYCSNAKISGNTVNNIIPGTGATSPSKRGFGIVEANGYVAGLTIENNHVLNSSDNDYWSGIYVSQSVEAIIANNIVRYTGTLASDRPLGIQFNYTGDKTAINSNICYGCPIWIEFNTMDGRVIVDGNQINNTYTHGLLLNNITGDIAQCTAIVTNNLISSVRSAGIASTSMTDVIISDNTIVDVNTANSSTPSVMSGIVFSTQYRATVANNKIKNVSTGHAKYGVSFGTNNYLTKWIYHDNDFLGMETANYGSGYTSFPAGLLWEIGDIAYNTSVTDFSAGRFKLLKQAAAYLGVEAVASDTQLVFNWGENDPLTMETGELIGIPLINNTVQWTTIVHIYDDRTSDVPTVTVYLKDALTGTSSVGTLISFRKWKNVESEAVTLYVKGVGSLADGRELRVNGRLLANGTGGTSSMNVGLMLTVFDADTMEMVSQQNYNTAGDEQAAVDLGLTIASLPNTQIGVLYSQNEFNYYFENSFGSGIRDACKSAGLFKLADIPGHTHGNYSYVGIFKGPWLSSVTDKNTNAIEVLQDGAVQDAIACTVIYKGGFVGNSNKYDSPRIIPGQGEDLVSANNLTLGMDGNTFAVTGNTDVNLIDSTGWSDGNSVTLIFTGEVDIADSYTPSGVYKSIHTKDGMTISVPAESFGTAVSFKLATVGGVQAWYQV